MAQEITSIQFPEIVNGKIKTEEFLAASKGVVKIVDKFGKVFAPVKYDMQGNVEKLTTKFLLDKEAHATLHDMILLEKAANQTIVATDALMWLRRALHLIQLFFEKIIQDFKSEQPTEDLVAFLKEAYKETLEPYHGWMAQQLFGLLSRMVPTRAQLLLALADGREAKEEDVVKDMSTFLVNLKANIGNLQKFYEQNNLENAAKV